MLALYHQFKRQERMVTFQKEVQGDLWDAHSCHIISFPFPGYLIQSVFLSTVI